MAIKRDKILKTAEKLVQKGKLEQAIREYEKVLADSPNDTNTVNRLGDLYGRVGEVDKAVGLYERVARQFADQGFVPKAIAIYKKINRLAPQRLDIFERLGELYVEQGLTVEAKSQFNMLAEHYIRNQDIGDAIRVRAQLDTLDPDDIASRKKFADLLLEAGEVERAMASYRELGEALIGRDRLDEAERLFRRLAEHELPDGEILAPICGRLVDAGRLTTAQELLSMGLDASPDSVALRTLQVRTFMALGETEPAVALAQEILKIDPDNPEVRGLVGGVLMSDGDREQATEMMIPAAEALLEQADYSRAQKMLQELVEVAPRDERVLRLAIRAFRPSGDQERVTRLTASLAALCFESGQEDQARRFYMELVASDPTNQLFRERLAQLDGIDVGAGDHAVTSGALVGETGDELPSEIDFVLDDGLAEPGGAETGGGRHPVQTFDITERLNEAAVFAKYGLNDKAIAHLEEIVRRHPDHLEARTQLARQYVAVGQSARAAGTIRPVIEHHRAAGSPLADELERTYPEADDGRRFDEDDDDEVIIVDLDEDVAGGFEEIIAEEAAESQPAPRDVSGADTESVDDMVAKAMADLGRVETPPPRSGRGLDASGEPAVSWGTDGDEVVPDEPEPIEEELVEISSGGDGPTSSELAQLDLFIDQELFEDAFRILERFETDYPGDEALAERRRRLREAETSSRTPAAAFDVEVPRPGPAAVPRTPDGLFDEEPEDQYIDLAKELELELAEEEAMVEEATGRGKGEAMLEEVFREFQRGVAEQLSEDDSDTHFNLGIAYKEMGLLEEAIGEFKVASHDPTFFVEACTMIGVCCHDLARHDEAAEWYQKALVAPDLSTEARTALRYELASALERTGEIDEAVGLYEEILAHDPAYRDAAQRLSNLVQQQRQIN